MAYSGESSVAYPNPFHFGQLDPDPDLFHQRVWVAQNLTKIMTKFHKINQNHKNFIHFLKNIILMFNGHKYLSHKQQIEEKNLLKKLVFSPI